MTTALAPRPEETPPVLALVPADLAADAPTLAPSSVSASSSMVSLSSSSEDLAVLAAHGKSFRFAGAFLSPAQLAEAATVYAFCRAVDDAVDEAPDLVTAQREAAALRAELDGEATPRPVVARFLALARRRGIDLTYARDLIAGVESDAAPTVRFDDDDELLRYCYRVAGTVGGLMCPIIGVTDPTALPFAIDLGVAMQLTNICRDVAEDFERGRQYLPTRRLQAQGGSALLPADGQPPTPSQQQATIDVVANLLALAEHYYESGSRGLRFIPWRPRLAIAVASRVYRAIGHKLLRRGGDPWQGRTSTTRGEKIRAALAAILSTMARLFDEDRARPQLPAPWRQAGCDEGRYQPPTPQRSGSPSP